MLFQRFQRYAFFRICYCARHSVNLPDLKPAMNLPFFIARRWTSAAPQKHTQRILRMGVACIAVCTAIMVLAVCILVGFRQGITHKVFGFGSHLQIQPYLLQDAAPYLDLSDPHITRLTAEHPAIKRWDPFLYKEGLLKGEDASIGIIFKGLPLQFDTAFFTRHLLSGRLPRFGEKPSNEILISEKTARTLRLEPGDKARTYFITGEQLRPRALTVTGIYKTGLSQFDATYILGDIRQIQRLDDLPENFVGGIDLQLHNPQMRHTVCDDLARTLPYEWSCYPCDRLFPEIFDWLALIDVNVWVLLVILWTVALISLLSILFICMISRKPQAAMLRGMGLGTSALLRVFLWQAALILGKGMLLGNLAGLLAAWLQWLTHAVRLNEEVYFLSHVPIAFPWGLIFAVNLVCIVIALLLLFLITQLFRKRYGLTQDLKALA